MGNSINSDDEGTEGIARRSSAASLCTFVDFESQMAVEDTAVRDVPVAMMVMGCHTK